MSSEEEEYCAERKIKALESLKVKRLLSKLEETGCSVNVDTFFKCQPCAPNEGIAGGFVPEGEQHVVLCQDNICKYRLGQDLVDRTVVHELIHAYDQCRTDMDWKNCLHVACTEIRAANLSGDCSFVNEFNRRNFGVKGQGRECVKRRAQLSLEAQPQCKDIAKEAVERVFKQCFADKAPFFEAFH